MQIVIDIDDKRIKGIKLLAKEQDIATPYPTLEQIIANGIPLDKIRAEIEQYQADCNLTNSDEIDCKFCDSITFDTIYRIIDKYRNEVSE